MENAKISTYQLFVLILLFEMGSSLVIGTGISAKQDAWLATLGGMVGGLFLFLIFYKIYQYYPGTSPLDIYKTAFGKFLGWIVGFAYASYFLYIAARVLRDLGEMLVTFSYSETPLLVINFIMICGVLYGVRKGIEVISRTGEILFSFLYVLAVVGFILIIFSQLIDVSKLKPVLEHGLTPVLKSIYSETLYVPYGETVVFMALFPYIKETKKIKPIGISAITLSGINLALTMVINIAVLGIDANERSPFPLLSTIQEIRIAEFLERLDVFFMLALVVGGFFKISIYFYASLTFYAQLFKIDRYQNIAYPLTLIVLCMSIMEATSYAEHIEEGLRLVPIYFHIPFQIIIPVILLVTIFIKVKWKKRKVKQRGAQSTMS